MVQRYIGKKVSVNLGKVDAILNEKRDGSKENVQTDERIKVYILEVKDTQDRESFCPNSNPELVKPSVESEVTEVRDGIVESRACRRPGFQNQDCRMDQ